MTAEEYLRSKLQKIDAQLEGNPETTKSFNKGARYLVESGVWRTRLSDWLAQSLDTLMVTHKADSKDGKRTKLTRVSAKIATPIAYEIGLDETNPRVTAHIGDLFIEAFYEEGVLTLERESMRKDAPWLICIAHPTYRKAVLKGTFKDCPEDISGMRSKCGMYIKGFTKDDEEEFKELVKANPPFIQALNKLRKTQWELNLPVLEAIRANPECFNPETIQLVFNETGEVHTFSIDHDFKGFRKTKWSHYDKKAVAEGRELEQFEGKDDPILIGKHSKRYDYLTVMGKAELIGDQAFYQEYTCDYRGRIYCGESYLQFQGSDVARGMFMFAEKKAYTANGIRRLKIHLANSFNCSFTKGEIPEYFLGKYDELLEKDGLETVSMDKLTLDDRVRWVDANIEMVRSQKTIHPKAEAPVSFLAACMELDKVLSDPDYKGGLPIPVDGSNNGWQHLAAMSKDPEAANLVSMTNVEYQRDFYVAVAKEMVRTHKSWFDKKQIPMGKIRKGIAKRGAMTRAYSAGKKKIRDNMLADCKKEGMVKTYNITKEDCKVLAEKLVDAVNEVCKGPLRVTKWLIDIVHHEVDNGAKDFEWETPSGFPVKYSRYVLGETSVLSSIAQVGRVNHIFVAPRTRKERIAGELSDVGPTIKYRDTGELMASRNSYITGIAPNVVHSYDAAHMSFVISRFEGCFGAVHDSFSTHASDVEDLLTITKGTFMGMYSMDSWFDDFKARIMKHGDTFTVPNPDLGTYTVDSVVDAEYFFC